MSGVSDVSSVLSSPGAVNADPAYGWTARFEARIK